MKLVATYPILAVVAMSICGEAVAQLPESISAETRVSLLTILPGDPAYTMFGHSAIRFADPVSGFDASFNYGTFDFDRTFVFRFAAGKLDYMLDVVPTGPSFRHYQRERRTIIEQRLGIDSNEAQALYQLLLVNFRPENRYYRYDFFLDNCSTRIRDVMESATGRSIPAPTEGSGTADRSVLSFRALLRPYIDGRPVLAALMNTGLGVTADRTATVRQHAFLPVELMHQFDQASPGPTGIPLVVSTDTLFVGSPPAPSRIGFAVTVAWVIVVLIGAVTAWRYWNDEPRLRWLDVIAFALTGLTGLLLAYLWFGSEHVVAGRNLNLLWALPTNIVMAGVVAKRHLPAWTRIYFAIVLTTSVVLLCGLSWWTQQIHVVVVPIAVLIAFRTGRCLLSATNRPA